MQPACECFVQYSRDDLALHMEMRLQCRVLRKHADSRAQLFEPELCDVDAVDTNRSRVQLNDSEQQVLRRQTTQRQNKQLKSRLNGLWLGSGQQKVVEAHHQCRFATACAPDNPHLLVAAHCERDIL